MVEGPPNVENPYTQQLSSYQYPTGNQYQRNTQSGNHGTRTTQKSSL